MIFINSSFFNHTIYLVFMDSKEKVRIIPKTSSSVNYDRIKLPTPLEYCTEIVPIGNSSDLNRMRYDSQIAATMRVMWQLLNQYPNINRCLNQIGYNPEDQKRVELAKDINFVLDDVRHIIKNSRKI